MKIRYIGDTFYGGLGLTNNKVYECTGFDEESGVLAVIDDEGEEYAYSIKAPSAPNGSSKPGKWEIVEDKEGILTKILAKCNR